MPLAYFGRGRPWIDRRVQRDKRKGERSRFGDVPRGVRMHLRFSERAQCGPSHVFRSEPRGERDVHWSVLLGHLFFNMVLQQHGS